jgi:hypothetical protein
MKQPHKRRAIAYEYGRIGTDEEPKLRNLLVSGRLLVELEGGLLCLDVDHKSVNSPSWCLRLLHSERIRDCVFVG